MNDGIITAVTEEEPEASADELFKPMSWLNKVEFIKHLSLTNNVLVSVLAEQGSGKTTFSQLLYDAMGEEITPCLVSASPLFDSERCLTQLGAQLNFEGEMTVSHFIDQTNQHKAHVILIIDDAHFLPTEFIDDMLAVMQQQGQGYFHACLVSNLSLVPELNRLAETHKDMIHSIELGHLTENETKIYVQHRLPSIPGADTAITDDDMKQFFQLTEGSIVGINSQMAGFFGTHPATRLRSSNMGRWAGVAAALVIVGAGVIYLAQPEATQLNTASVQMAQLPPPMPPMVPVAKREVIIAQPDLISEVPSYKLAAVRQVLQSTPMRRNELVAVNDEDETSDDSLVVMDKVVVIPKVMPKKTPVVAVNPAKLQKPSPVTAAAARPAPKEIAKIVKPPVGKAPFTIQLLGSHNKAELQRFAKTHQLQNKARILQTHNNGAVWYVLAIGRYGQRDTARKEIARLPQGLAQFKPWVREMGDLHG